MVLITLLLAAGAAAVVFAAAAPPLRTTVDVLPSLDSLTPLTLRVRTPVAAVALVALLVGLTGDDGAAVAPRRVLAVPAVGADVVEELVVDEAVVGLLRVAAAVRVERAFSTMLLRRVEAVPFVGETGLASPDLAGDGARGAIRVFEDAGERTWPCLA
jgi:hypothetical protein